MPDLVRDIAVAAAVSLTEIVCRGVTFFCHTARKTDRSQQPTAKSNRFIQLTCNYVTCKCL